MEVSVEEGYEVEVSVEEVCWTHAKFKSMYHLYLFKCTFFTHTFDGIHQALLNCINVDNMLVYKWVVGQERNW